ncbi:glycosyltransferase [Flavobacterium sp. UMI-01]|uniref:glycosyltransferase n=1 Tax=Flavobacterium sp. UMI-01 TaxID=1441053 RepID=UPI001C7DA33D|nr:glycosyltransferase [Flavobacterium sp. UMI-01]GIZ10044.1 glycosyl transferase family 1 [Flavobacterium sp. UMI-01]
MKVIHFIAHIDKSEGGTAEYMRLLSSALKNHVELIIATGFSPHPVEIKGVRVHFFNTKIVRWFFNTKEFSLFLKKEKPNLVHINGVWNPQNWAFQKAAQNLGIKVIVSPHGMLEPWIMKNNPVKKKIALFLYQRKALMQSQYLHATAQMEADNIQTLGFKNPISIIPNGIDLQEVLETKTQYGSRKMVFISRIHPKKGIELLLEAWSKCNTNGWLLEIAGNGEDKYVAQLNESALGIKNVHFVGAKYGEAKWKFLKSADVMVLPTHSENFGIVVAEALALGIPVITTQGTPWNDLETYQCGWWIPLSVANLEKTIAKAINTPAEQLQIMGERGRQLVAEKYEIKVTTNQLLQLYQKILT